MFTPKKGQDYRNAFNLVNQLTKKVIFTNNSNRAALLKKASYYSDCVDQVTILCLTSDTITPVESNDHYILNHYYLGIQVATIFLESVRKQYLKENYIIPNDGFPKTNLKSYPNTTIKMLTLSSPTSHAIVNLAKDFTRKTSIEIDITILPYDQFNLELETNSQAYDLIRTDMALLSYQGQTIYQELDGISTELDQLIKRFGHFYQETFMEIGKSVYALPLDPSVQMLFYREDIFSNQIVQRTFFERYKKELKLPTSFEEYTELVTFFSTEKLGVDYGTVINTKNPVIIASEFLSAYYSLGGKLVENETSINLDPAFSEEAMRLYKLLHDQAKAIDKNWWNDLVKAFSNGNVAMIIGYINHLSTIADSEIGSLISYTSVPNHHPILGGGVIGITKSSLLVEPSSQFLLWLHTAEVSKEITLLGGTSVDSKIGQSEMVHQTYPWLLSIDQTLKTGIRETNLAVDKGFNLIKFEELIGQTINNLVENDDYKETANKLNEVLTSHAANYLTKSIKKN